MASRPSPSATGAEPDADLLAELSRELGQAFDLSARIGERTLAEAVEGRLRSLRTLELPQWGGAGEITQVAQRESGSLDFYYRPHLFAGMDPALRLGHQLQFDLLPRSLPARSPVRIAAVLESYCHLSGDLLGWHLEGEELFLWIADVSGHGVRAGLAAAVLYLLIGSIDPRAAPGEAARGIHQGMRSARNPGYPSPVYATGFWLRVGADGRARYASSGHPSMLLRRRGGKLEPLPSTGPPAGLLPAAEYREVDLRLESGDSLCLFTDGVTEATDAGGTELGQSGLAAVLAGTRGAPIEEARAVYDAVRNHRESTLLEDDLTFMIVQPVE